MKSRTVSAGGRFAAQASIAVRTTMGCDIASICAQNAQGLWALKSASVSVYFTVYMGEGSGKTEKKGEAEHMAEFKEWANRVGIALNSECNSLS